MLLHGVALFIWLGYWCLLLVADVISIFYLRPGKAVTHASGLMLNHPRRTPGTPRRRRPPTSPIPPLPSLSFREHSSMNRQTSPLSTKSSDALQNRWPGVSLIKPLKGKEPCLQANLESFFQLTYPEYEIIIAVEDAQDPARSIAEKLMENYPHVLARISIASQDGVLDAVNPKIRNMMAAFQLARYDLIWTSDSNVFVSDNVLFELVGRTVEDRRVGLVHQLPVASAPPYPCFAGYLESLYLCTAMARPYIFANFVLHTNCAMGKSMLLRKQVLDRHGGIVAYAQYLAEDYYIGKTFLGDGMSIEMVREPIHQCVCEYSLKVFAQRRIRWSRLRIYTVPLTVLMEPFSQSVPSGLIAAFALSGFLDSILIRTTILLLHFLLWFACDIMLLRRLTTPKGISPTRLTLRQSSYLVCAWILREITYLPIFVAALSGREVVWRGNRFRLSPRGQVICLSSTPESNADEIVARPDPSTRAILEASKEPHPSVDQVDNSSLRSQKESMSLPPSSLRLSGSSPLPIPLDDDRRR